MFNHILGESLETQLQRFVLLVTQMRASKIELTLIEVIKKLLNFPSSELGYECGCH